MNKVQLEKSHLLWSSSKLRVPLSAFLCRVFLLSNFTRNEDLVLMFFVLSAMDFLSLVGSEYFENHLVTNRDDQLPTKCERRGPNG